MIYIKVFLIVRRQVRSMPADVPDLLVQEWSLVPVCDRLRICSWYVLLTT